MTHRKIHIEKAAGLGITEFFLRWFEWMALTSKELENSQIEIVVGPNRNQAKILIQRMVGSREDNIDFHDLERRGIATNITDYSFNIGTVLFEAAPSDNIDATRGKTNCKIYYIDEAAFFLMTSENEEQIRNAAEHYDLKSMPWIIWVSTPGYFQSGIFWTIKMEEPSMYKRTQLSYELGLEVHPESFTSIYTRDGLDEAKKSPSFDREYRLIWGNEKNSFFGKFGTESQVEGEVPVF